MSLSAELEAALILHALAGPGPAELTDLYRRLGSFQAILTAAPHSLPPASQVAVRAYQANPAAHCSAVRAAVEPLLEVGIQILALGVSGYPALLAELTRPPLILYVRGSVAALALPQIAIVGSRQSSASGVDTAGQFGEWLAASGFAVTSGLALGIDAAAHRGALRTGITIAVLGSGIDRIYPRQHQQLADAMVAGGGALVSEFAPGTPPRAEHFPRRNRIISGLSLGVLVVEAAPRSGSLITARLALEQGREVFAVPGSIHNPLAKGCHQLLREGATLVETGDDIVAQLGGLLAYQRAEAYQRQEPKPDADVEPTGADDDAATTTLTPAEIQVLQQMGFDPIDLDSLVARTGFAVATLSGTLVGLELQGLVSSRDGLFTRLRRRP